MKLVVPSEILENENRVGVTPDCVTSLIKMGFKVFVQSNAGINSSYSDLVDRINATGNYDEETESHLNSALEEFKKTQSW